MFWKLSSSIKTACCDENCLNTIFIETAAKIESTLWGALTVGAKNTQWWIWHLERPLGACAKVVLNVTKPIHCIKTVFMRPGNGSIVIGQKAWKKNSQYCFAEENFAVIAWNGKRRDVSFSAADRRQSGTARDSTEVWLHKFVGANGIQSCVSKLFRSADW